MFETLVSPIQEPTFDHAKFTGIECVELGIKEESGVYTNLGLLLSDQCRHVINLCAYNSEGKISQSQKFSGSVVKQINDIGEFLNRGDWKQLREILCAALIQRDYSFPSELLLNVYPDRVSIIAMGRLADGFSSWRNERLYTALRRLRFSVCKPALFNATEGAFMIVRENEQSPEQKIINHLREFGSCNRKEAEAVLELKQTAAGKVLRDLHERGIISPIGNGKNKKYLLVK